MNKLLFYLTLFFSLWFIAPVDAQQVGITSPTTGEIIDGVVLVRGTATDPNFAYYQLFIQGNTLLDKNGLLVIQGDQPVFDNTLYVWDTTFGQEANSPVFLDGIYQLRLKVIRKDFTSVEYFVTGLTVKNNTGSIATITPAPTKELPPVTTAPSPTPGQPTIAPITTADPVTLAPSPAVTPTEIPVATTTPPSPTTSTVTTTVELPPPPTQPSILPSLTPFPSPTPAATAANQSFSPSSTGKEEAKKSGNNQAELIINELLQFDYGVFRRGFQQGFLWTFGLFALLGVFLVLRGIFRWIRRTIFSNW